MGAVEDAWAELEREECEYQSTDEYQQLLSDIAGIDRVHNFSDLHIGMLAKIGAAFGRVCGDPESYLDRLMDSNAAFGLSALVQITRRCKWQVYSHASEIAGLAEDTG